MRHTGTIHYSATSATFTSALSGTTPSITMRAGDVFSQDDTMILFKGVNIRDQFVGTMVFRLVILDIEVEHQKLPPEELLDLYKNERGTVLWPGVGRFAFNAKSLKRGLWHRGLPQMENVADPMFIQLGLSRRSFAFKAVPRQFDVRCAWGAGGSDRHDVSENTFSYIADLGSTEVDGGVQAATWFARFAHRTYLGGRKDVVLIEFRYIPETTDWAEVRKSFEAHLGFNDLSSIEALKG